MSRKIRSINAANVLEPERAANLSHIAFRVWVGGRMIADDYGTFRAGAKSLAAVLLQDTSRVPEVEAALLELEAAGFVELYSVAGDRFGFIVGWDDEQRIDRRSDRDRLPSREDPRSTKIQSLVTDSAANSGESPRHAASDGDSPESAGSRVPFRSVSVPDPIRERVRAKRSSPIAADWQPKPETFAALEVDGLDARSLVAGFRDYWIGEGKTKADWDAAFRNWVRRLAAEGKVPAYQAPLKLAIADVPDESPPADPNVVADVLANLPKFGGAA